MIDLTEFKYKTKYNDCTYYTQGFNPGDKAEWRYDDKVFECVVMDSVAYNFQPDKEQQDKIWSLEEYGYDCTAEFIEDDCSYFVAFNVVRMWKIQVVHLYSGGIYGQFVEKEWLYHGTREELYNFVAQFGREEFGSQSRYIDFKPYDPPELITEMPKEYLRENRHGWIHKDNVWVPENEDFAAHAAETDELPF